MNSSTRKSALISTTLFFLLCGAAQADGLKDLKAALTRLQGQTPIKAVLDVKTWRRTGEGKEAHEIQGQASANVEDSARGLQILFAADTLAHAEAEKRAQGKNPDATTPTLSALEELGATELHPLASSANSLLQMLDEASFKDERTETYNGKPARVLHFDYSIDKLATHDRKYIKKFEMGVDVWIAADGTPLASRTIEEASGRAFLVVSFAQKSTEECVYALVGDRLVTVRKTANESSSGAGESAERKTTKTLQLLS
jgi:hypothetical protein